MKGLEESSGKRLSQIVEEILSPSPKIAVWVGPGHVQDFVNGVPNCMVLDSKDETVKAYLIDAFKSPLIRFYRGDDLIGNEIGAAAKNTMGIAAGLLDGIGMSSLKGALMSRGTDEIAKLIVALGGKERTTYGLSHLGDYQATLFSTYSNNRLFGEMFIQGKTCQKLCEGVSTTKALLNLGEQYRVHLPICRAVDNVIHKHCDPKKIISEFFARA
jgi:glycerol-3-phosphate dehydrogenase (NAD(P)+)